MSFPEPTLTHVDGIPLWCTDVPGPCAGGIAFRSGRVDETLVTTGINHLIEHLALSTFALGASDVNGTSTTLTTRFFASGTQEHVEAFLTEVCKNLSSLPIGRLEAEHRILEAESRRRGGSYAGVASSRFGTRGIGVVDYPEHIGGLAPDVVMAWAAERFTAGQAVVWMTRPPSPGLRLPLPPGDLLPLPVVEPLPGLVTPSHVESDGQFIGCSMVDRRSLPMFVAVQLFLARGFQRLRHELGLAYTVSQDSARVSATHSTYELFCDSPAHEMGAVLPPFCDVLESLASGELGEAEVLAACDRALPWNATDPNRPNREAARKADAHLLGHTPTTWTELAAQRDALTPADVQQAMTSALDTAILAAPAGLPIPERFDATPYVPTYRRRFGRLYVRWDTSANDLVTMNDHGLTREIGPTVMSAEFDEVDALILGADGSTYLIRRDAFGVPFEPNQLMNGRALVAALQERLADKVIDLRGDAVAWFEMQAIVETHDRELVRSVWREIEILAGVRRLHERVLMIAVADLDGHRGLFAVTDHRFLHIAAERPEPIYWGDRADIAEVLTSSGIRGGRLVLRIHDRTIGSLDRIKPRGRAAELAALLSPIENE